MMRGRPAFAAVTLLLAFAGCTATLSSFVVPSLVWAGHEFEIVVQGSGNPTSMQGSYFSCVLQVPNGFTVESAVGSAAPPIPTRDDPTTLALYTAEPNHYLASFTGYIASPYGSLSVILRAPPTAGGPHTFKVSLVSGNQITDPPGVGNFAAITATTHTKVVTLVADPVTLFDLARDGLPTPTVVGPQGVTSGDIDLDGNDDLLLATTNGYQAWLSRPGSQWVGRPATGVAPGPEARAGLGDFNGDGLPDLADPSGRIFHGDGQGNWLPGPLLPLLGSVHGVAVGDFDRDGRDDVAFAGLTPAAVEFVQVFRNHGNGTFTQHNGGLPTVATSSPTGGHDLLLTDVTGDGIPDVIWTPSSGANVWAGDGQGNWTAGTGLPANAQGGIAVGDLTGDGVPELVLAEDPGGWGALGVYHHLGGNQWAAVANTGLPSSARGSVALLDFDRDGRLDLVLSDGEVVLWRNLGGATFTPTPNTGLLAFTRFAQLTVGDYDGDSFPDLAATSASVPHVWLNLGTGLSPYGAACSATGFPTPALGANGLPQRGNAAFAVELHGGLANGAGLVWLGLSKRFAHGAPMLPLPLVTFGAPGCELLAEDLAVHVRWLDASGFAALPLPIPNSSALVRMTLFGQGATWVPGANALGILFSGGLALRIE